MKKFFITFFALIMGVWAGYYFLYDHGYEKEVKDERPAQTSKSRAFENIMAEEVIYFKDIKGYLALPQAPGKYPAIILIHEWWGLNDNIKDFARTFANEGYLALAVDLYEGKTAVKSDKARELAFSVRENLDRAFQNLRGAITYLKAHPKVQTENLASVGWCFGGGWSYQMAKNDLGVDASIMYYGQFNTEDDLSHMRAQILGHFGNEDSSIKVDDVKEFQATLKTLSGEHEIFIYPNSGHGFANKDGAAYNKEAADLAWQRTLAFLEKHLVPKK